MKIELVRHWSISTVYRATTRMGKYYFKQSPAFFPNEVPVTVAIANRFPDVSPRVLASDARSRWMLLDDLGDVTMQSADPHTSEGAALWIAAVRALARIQRAYAITPSPSEGAGGAGDEPSRAVTPSPSEGAGGAGDEPSRAVTPSPLTGEGWDGGELERRPIPATLATIRDWTLAPPSGDLLHHASETAAALRRLAPHLPRLTQLQSDLTAANLPPTLNHGDLDAGNIFIRDGVPILMDWSDACITNPLFDPVQIPQVADNPRIADAYLSQWTDRAPIETLRTAFRAAAPLAALERAIHYRRNIVPHIPSPSDDRRHLEAYIPDLLNRAANLL